MVPIEKLSYSAASKRNQNAILETISPYLSQAKNVLEIGTGSAQHAMYFASFFPELIWQTSDQFSYLERIRKHLNNALIENIKYPIELDVNQKVWDFGGQLFDVIYTANTFHIMSQKDVEAFFTGLTSVSASNVFLIIYGPFKYAGKFTSDSNQQFDQRLRSGERESSIKDFEFITALAEEQGFQFVKDHMMPANNQCLIWQKSE